MEKDDLEEPRVDRPDRAGRLKRRRVTAEALVIGRAGYDTGQPSYPPWDLWVSASSTRNYLIKDPLLDWLSYYSSTLNLTGTPYGAYAKTVKSRSDSFTDFILNQGIEFESKVIQYMYKKHGRDVILDIGGNTNARDLGKAKETLEAMNRGVPIIYQGVLHNLDDLTYGVPDLIVRSDWLNHIVKEEVLDEELALTSAPNLTNCIDEELGSDERSPPKYHYRIVDIKFSSLHLRADGVHLLNSGSIPAYKGQLYIYTKTLGKLQGYQPPEAYMLGRKWKYQSKSVVYKGKSCFDRLGVIDYEGVDKMYVDRTASAVSWIKDMRRDGASWSVGPDLPLCRSELYPNMSNQQDYPWRPIKKKIAEDIGEITSLWMCGVKNRNIAIANNVYRWTDERCTTETLGINGPKIKRVLDKILEINRGGGMNPIHPPVVLNNDQGWQRSQTIEFFVDFEFINDVVSDIGKSVPEVHAKSIIFMIGVGHYAPGTGGHGQGQLSGREWIYKEFTVNSLTESEEYKICTKFSQYIREESDWWDCPNPLLIHWSNAENWQWKNATERHKNPRLWIPAKNKLLDVHTDESPRWFDLLQVFRSEPIVIRGCLGFGLKEVATTLANLGLIQTRWNYESSCVDGSSAMITAYNAYKDAKKRGISMRDMPLIKDVIKYNEVDCKAIAEIMTYLREHHIPGADEVQIFD
jgi:hypothetical protein